jgi:hypothetical protein
MAARLSYYKRDIKRKKRKVKKISRAGPPSAFPRTELPPPCHQPITCVISIDLDGLKAICTPWMPGDIVQKYGGTRPMQRTARSYVAIQLLLLWIDRAGITSPITGTMNIIENYIEREVIVYREYTRKWVSI